MILRKSVGIFAKRAHSSALGFATVSTAMSLNAKCIIAPSMSGATARVVSKFKPKTEIIGISLMVHRLEECRFTGECAL